MTITFCKTFIISSPVRWLDIAQSNGCQCCIYDNYSHVNL